MLLRVYSLLVLSWDLLNVVMGCAWAILESFIHLIRPPNEKPVQGEVVLIVGAGRGIGRELAIQFAALGAIIVCWDINEEANKSIAQQICDLETGSCRAYAFTCDITDRDQVLATADAVKKQVGDVTILVHCCGVPSPHSLLSNPAPDVRSTMELVIISYFWILDAFLPRMLEMNYGHIVALTSVAGLSGLRDQVPLCAAQFAVQGMVEALSEELRLTKPSTKIYFSLFHIYPFMVSSDDITQDIRLRIPSYFGTIDPKDAASQIISGMRRNYTEISVPGYLLYLSKLSRILPRKGSVMLRELLDTGVDFG